MYKIINLDRRGGKRKSGTRLECFLRLYPPLARPLSYLPQPTSIRFFCDPSSTLPTLLFRPSRLIPSLLLGSPPLLLANSICRVLVLVPTCVSKPVYSQISSTCSRRLSVCLFLTAALGEKSIAMPSELLPVTAESFDRTAPAEYLPAPCVPYMIRTWIGVRHSFSQRKRDV